MGVAWIQRAVARVSLRQRWRNCVIIPRGRARGFFAKNASALFFGQSLHGAIVPLIEPPSARDGNIALVKLLQGQKQRGFGALEHGAKRAVKAPSGVAKGPPCRARLFVAKLGEFDIGPSCVEALLVPSGFAVADEDYFGHGVCFWRLYHKGPFGVRQGGRLCMRCGV